MRREAVLSSRIEGTRASLSDILLDEVRADVPLGGTVPIPVLARAGMLREIAGRKWEQLYAAQSLLKIIDRPLA